MASVEDVTVVMTFTTTSPTSKPSLNAQSKSSYGNPNPLSAGAISGIIIGSLIGAVVLGAGIWYMFRVKRSGGAPNFGENKRHGQGLSLYGTAKVESIAAETYEFEATNSRRYWPEHQHPMSFSGFESSYIVTPLAWSPRSDGGSESSFGDQQSVEGRSGSPPSRNVGTASGSESAVRPERHLRTSSDTVPLLPNIALTGDGRISMDLDAYTRSSRVLPSNPGPSSVISKPAMESEAMCAHLDIPSITPSDPFNVSQLLKTRAMAIPPICCKNDREETFETFRSYTLDSERSRVVDAVQVDAVPKDLEDSMKWVDTFGQQDDNARAVMEKETRAPKDEHQEDGNFEDEVGDDEFEIDSPESLYSQASYQHFDLPPWMLHGTESSRSGSALSRTGSSKTTLRPVTSKNGSGRSNRVKVSCSGSRAPQIMDTVPELPGMIFVAPSALRLSISSPPLDKPCLELLSTYAHSLSPSESELPIPTLPNPFLEHPHIPPSNDPQSHHSLSSKPSTPLTPTTSIPNPQSAQSYPLLSSGSSAFLPQQANPYSLSRDRLSVGSSLSTATSVWHGSGSGRSSAGWGLMDERYPSITASTITTFGSSERSNAGDGSASYASSNGSAAANANGITARSRQEHTIDVSTSATTHSDFTLNSRRQNAHTNSYTWNRAPAGLRALADSNLLASKPSDSSSGSYVPRSQCESDQGAPRRAHLRRPSAHRDEPRFEQGEAMVRSQERIAGIDIVLT